MPLLRLDREVRPLSLVLLSLALARCALPHAGLQGSDTGADRADGMVSDGEGGVTPMDGGDVIVPPLDVVDGGDVADASDDAFEAGADADAGMDAADAADATVEPGPEAGTEPGPEAGAEPGPEAGPEPGPEAGAEPGPEAGPEAGPDADVDAGADADVDAGADGAVEIDATMDAAMDVPAVDAAADAAPDADPTRPTRCADIRGVSGVVAQTLYAGATSWSALCDFNARGGPWTLVAKVDPTDLVWAYSNARWTNTTLLNAVPPNENRQSAKYRGFNTLAFSAVRLDFITNPGLGFETNTLTFAHDSAGQSLQQIFSAGTRIDIAGTTRDTWLGAIPTVAAIFPPALVSGCNRIAFNARGDDPMHTTGIRIGILANDGDCNRPTSWIGVGGSPTDGTAGANHVSGNRNESILASRRTPSFVFLWLR